MTGPFLPGRSASGEWTSAADPARLLRMARGFSCLFWSLPLLSASHAVALSPDLPSRWLFVLMPACFPPLAWGLWMLRASGDLTPRWKTKVGRAALLALAAAGLCPFLAWWSFAPLRLYFAANAGLHYGASVGLLVALNQLAGEGGRWLGDASLRRESMAGLGMVAWLSACTAGALAWLFHRAGILEAGLPTVLGQLAELPREARHLFLLPYAVTAYVMWRAKETGFRRAASFAP